MRDDIGELAEVPHVSDDDDAEDMGDEDAVEGTHSPMAELWGPFRRVAPLIAIVPPMTLVAISSFLVVFAFVVVLLSFLSGSGTSSAASGDHGAKATSASVSTRPSAAATKVMPIVDAAYPPPTPAGPTVTPTAVIWEPSGTGWIGYGAQGADRRILLMPDKLNRIDDRRENYTLTTRFAVLTASGEGAPLFALALSYFSDTNFVLLESYTQKRQPYMKLSWAKDGNGGPIGEPIQLPIAFWGRETHELKVSKSATSIRASLNKEDLGEWPILNYTPGGVKGMFIWFGSRMRFDSFLVSD